MGHLADNTQELVDLRRALSSLPGLVGMALSRRDGFPVWGSGFREAALRWVSAAAAAMIGTAEATASHLEMHPFEKVLVSFGQRDLLLLGCSMELILILLFKEGADLEFAFARAKELGPRVAELLESRPA
ncbi:MAG: hypothetical protein ACE5KQ_04850 [Thermoplasmata archaeon]